jgi:hypothetical protein
LNENRINTTVNIHPEQQTRRLPSGDDVIVQHHLLETTSVNREFIVPVGQRHLESAVIIRSEIPTLMIALDSDRSI